MNRQKIACNCKNITYGMIEDVICRRDVVVATGSALCHCRSEEAQYEIKKCTDRSK